jgi:MFS family permease
LRNRDLRYVFASTLVSDLGDGVITVALAFAVLDLTGSVTDLGLIMAARLVTQVVVMLVGGVVADRMSRRTVMVAADLVRFGGQAAIGALLIAGHATVLELALSQVLIGAGGSFFIPASSGLLQTVAGEHIQEANALKVIASLGSSMLGPALGGALVVAIGAKWALVFDGASYLASALLLARLGHAASAAIQREATDSTFLADLRGGFGEVRSRRWLWSTIIGMAIANLFYAAFPVLAPVICRQHYGGAPAYSALWVCFAVGMLLGGSSLLRFKPRYPLRAGLTFGAPALAAGVALGLHAPIYIVGLLQITAGAGATASNALWWTAMQQNVPPAAMSRVISYEYASTLSIVPVGAALAGPFAHAIGVSPALVLCSAAAVAVNLIVLLVPDIRHLEAKDVAAPGEARAELAGA